MPSVTHVKARNILRIVKYRCGNPNSKDFKYYGGRGIKVCDRWLESFDNFLEDMGEPPASATLDRINNNGNYEKDNCRWASRLEQGNNRRTNRLLEFHGKSMTIRQWARHLNIPFSAIHGRLNRGWDIERVLTTPLRPNKKTKLPQRNSPNASSHD